MSFSCLSLTSASVNAFHGLPSNFSYSFFDASMQLNLSFSIVHTRSSTTLVMAASLLRSCSCHSGSLRCPYCSHVWRFVWRDVIASYISFSFLDSSVSRAANCCSLAFTCFILLSLLILSWSTGSFSGVAVLFIGDEARFTINAFAACKKVWVDE